MTEGGATDAEARDFAAAFRRLLEWVHSGAGDRNEVAGLVQDALGPDGVAQSVVARVLPAFEHVNLQTALDAWGAAPGRRVEVHGVVLPPHYGGIDLQQLITGEGLPPVRLSAPAVVDLPNGPGSTLACLRLALLVVTDAAGRYLLMVQGPREHEQPSLRVEVAGLPVPQAQAVLAELDRLRGELNVYRGRRPARRRPRPRRTARPRGRRAPRGAAGRRPAPQARPAALRPARHRQDAHHALPARPHGGLHPPAAHRPVPAHRGLDHRARP
jgi:hypothetical protein